MMKTTRKYYIQPQIKVVVLASCQPLLTLSQTYDSNESEIIGSDDEIL